MCTPISKLPKFKGALTQSEVDAFREVPIYYICIMHEHFYWARGRKGNTWGVCPSWVFFKDYWWARAAALKLVKEHGYREN